MRRSKLQGNLGSCDTMVYAVIDTNVLVSALVTSNFESPTISIMHAIPRKVITPIYSRYLLDEYREVLSRDKFGIDSKTIELMLRLFTDYGMSFEPSGGARNLPDMDDVPIYMIAMETRDLNSYLVTGNIKHYPEVDYVVTPRMIMEILGGDCLY